MVLRLTVQMHSAASTQPRPDGRSPDPLGWVEKVEKVEEV